MIFIKIYDCLNGKYKGRATDEESRYTDYWFYNHFYCFVQLQQIEADLANFLIGQLSDKRHLKKSPFIASI
jgi:hypothetical protein